MYQRLYFPSLGSLQVHFFFLNATNVRAIPPGTISQERFKEIRRVKGQQLPFSAPLGSEWRSGEGISLLLGEGGDPSCGREASPPRCAERLHPHLLSTGETFLFLRLTQHAKGCFPAVLTALLPLRYRCVATEPNQITPIYIFIKSPVKSPIHCCCYI